MKAQMPPICAFFCVFERENVAKSDQKEKWFFMKKKVGIGVAVLLFVAFLFSFTVLASSARDESAFTGRPTAEPSLDCPRILTPSNLLTPRITTLPAIPSIYGTAERAKVCDCENSGCGHFEHRAPDEVIECPWLALEMLMEGNWRFATDELMPRDTNLTDRWINATGQWPFAAIVTCSDSRVAPEIYFDQKVGDLFVVRNAGNIADSTALGSLEFAVEFLGAPLVVVVGHTECGAVINAHAGATGLADNLQGVLDHVMGNIEDSECADSAKTDNVFAVVEQIRANPVIERMGAVVVGAIFDIASGRVILLDDALCCA